LGIGTTRASNPEIVFPMETGACVIIDTGATGRFRARVIARARLFTGAFAGVDFAPRFFADFALFRFLPAMGSYRMAR